MKRRSRAPGAGRRGDGVGRSDGVAWYAPPRPWGGADDEDPRASLDPADGARTPLGGWDHDVDPEGEPAHPGGGADRRGWSAASAASTPVRRSWRAACGLVREAPWCLGDSAIGRSEWVKDKPEEMVWQGRGGAVEHAISGIDIALWDLFGKVTNQPVARLLGGNYRDQDQAVRLDPLRRAGRRCARSCRRRWPAASRRSSSAGGRSAGATRKTDELLVRTAREAVGPDVELMVDAGGSEQFWPHGYKWALRDGEDAGRLRRGLVRGGAAAGRPRGLRRAAAGTRRCRSRPARC